MVKKLQVHVITAVFFTAVLLLNFADAFAAAPSTDAFDLVVKIKNLENTLNTIDKLGAPFMSKGTVKSPTLMIRSLLQGTDWIDPDRLIVIGIKVEGQKAGAALFIPFVRTNPGFHSAFGAKAGENYYLLPLPPGRENENFTPEDEHRLADISKSNAASSLSAEIQVAGLIEKNQAQIQKLIENSKAANSAKLTDLGMTQQQVADMWEQLVGLGSQTRRLSIGMDLTSEKLDMLFEMEAAKGSDLHALFDKKSAKNYLTGYDPAYPIRFRSTTNDFYQKSGKMMNDIFGPLYRSLGIDVAALVEISRYFTGEMTGGISIAPKTMNLEMVLVMKQPDDGNFLEEIYAPWLLRYSMNITQMLEKQTGTNLEPIFARTQDTTVAGHHVMGIRIKYPVPPGGIEPAQPQTPSAGMSADLKMTVAGRYFIVASDDKGIEKLIRMSAGLKEASVDAPVMQASFDLNSYLNAIAQATGKTMPEMALGNWQTIFDVKDGRAFVKNTLLVDDILKIVRAGQRMGRSNALPDDQQPAPKPVTGKASVADKAAEDVPGGSKKTAEDSKNRDAAYWLGQGTLLANYGNDKAAISRFKRAVELNPRMADGYFQLGVSYGEIGEYAKAIEALNDAIRLNPKKHVYWYGRGRVLLLAGEKEKASQDLKKAADMGNEDAQNYFADDRKAIPPSR